MRRAVLVLPLALLLLVAAGCGGGEVVAPTPATVEGTIAEEETVAGDAEAGKALYAEQGCGSCHTFEPAGTEGTVGPDLGELAAHAEEAGRGTLEEYTAESIRDPNVYIVEGFQRGIMPPYAELGDKKIADLVAFLTQSS